MLKHCRTALIFFAIALFVLAPIYAVLTSSNFASCQQYQGQYPTADNDYNESSVVLVTPPNGVRVFWRCLGGYATAASDAITAISTLLMLIVTALLGFVAYRQYTTTRAQLRAYVFVTQDKKYSPKLDGLTIQVRLHMDNSGQTPAHSVVQATSIGFRANANSAPTAGVDPDNIAGASRHVLPPGGGLAIVSKLTITEAEKTALLAENGARIYVWGIVKYVDVFGKHRKTHFRFWVGGPKIETGCALQVSAKGNSAT